MLHLNAEYFINCVCILGALLDVGVYVLNVAHLVYASDPMRTHPFVPKVYYLNTIIQCEHTHTLQRAGVYDFKLLRYE